MKNISKYFLFFLILIIFNNCFSKQNIIKNIRTSDKLDEVTTRIVLDLSHKTAYSVFTLDNKPRLVIDIEATESKGSYDLKSKLIEKVRISNDRNGVIDFMNILRSMPSIDIMEFTIEDIVRSGFVKEYLIAKLEIGI